MCQTNKSCLWRRWENPLIRFDFRHGEAINLLFVDGHASRYSDKGQISTEQNNWNASMTGTATFGGW